MTLCYVMSEEYNAFTDAYTTFRSVNVIIYMAMQRQY